MELAVKELAGLNPTPAPARSESCSAAGSSRGAGRRPAATVPEAFAKWSTKNLQILSADGLENFIELGPMTVSARAPIRAVGRAHRGEHLHDRHRPLRQRRQEDGDDAEVRPRHGGSTNLPRRRDEDQRGNKGSVFVHVREGERDGDGDGAAESTSGGESTAWPGDDANEGNFYEGILS